MCVCHFVNKGDPYVTTTHDVIGQSQVTWELPYHIDTLKPPVQNCSVETYSPFSFIVKRAVGVWLKDLPILYQFLTTEVAGK